MNDIEKDQELVEKAKKNRRAFGTLYVKYAKDIYRFLLYRVNKNKEIAEDLMQETFLCAYRNLNSFKNMGYKYSSYLLKIAHNLLVNYYRRPKELPIGENELNIPAKNDSDVAAKERAEAVYAVVKTFSLNEQKIFTLRYIEQLKIEEIRNIFFQNRLTPEVFESFLLFGLTIGDLEHKQNKSFHPSNPLKDRRQE